MLVFVFQLISDAGYQGEITSVSTACHQIEVFSRVLKTSVCSFLEEGEQTIDNNLPEFSVSLCHEVHFMSIRVCTRLNIHLLLLLFDPFCEQKMVCYGQHTYLYAQCLLNHVAQNKDRGNKLTRLSQELQRRAVERYGNLSF